MAGRRDGRDHRPSITVAFRSVRSDAVRWREVPVEWERDRVRRDRFRERSEPWAHELAYPVVVEPLARRCSRDYEVFEHQERDLMSTWVYEEHRPFHDADDIRADSVGEPGRASPGGCDVVSGERTVVVVPREAERRLGRLRVSAKPPVGA